MHSDAFVHYWSTGSQDLKKELTIVFIKPLCKLFDFVSLVFKCKSFLIHQNQRELTMTLARCALYCYNALKVTSIVQHCTAHSFIIWYKGDQ